MSEHSRAFPVAAETWQASLRKFPGPALPGARAERAATPGRVPPRAAGAPAARSLCSSARRDRECAPLTPAFPAGGAGRSPPRGCFLRSPKSPRGAAALAPAVQSPAAWPGAPAGWALRAGRRPGRCPQAGQGRAEAAGAMRSRHEVCARSGRAVAPPPRRLHGFPARWGRPRRARPGPGGRRWGTSVSIKLSGPQLPGRAVCLLLGPKS